MKRAALLLLLAACGAPPKPVLTADEERVLRPIPDLPEGVPALVDRGDALFVKAIATPTSALDLYGQARASYLEAQAHCSGIVPQALLDRVRECVIRIAALQRQRHSTP